MNLIVDGLHISGLDQGQGPVALLLHGWGNDHRALIPVAGGLKGYRVIIPDLPGFGGSQPPNEAWGVEGYAQFCRDLLAKLAVDKIDVLIGHSFGGRISLVLAGEKMLPIEKMVLLSSHGLPESSSPKLSMLKALAKVGRLAPKPIRRVAARKLASTDFLEARGIMKEVFKRVIAQDATSQASAVDCPTLLIYGERDSVTPPDMGRRLHGLIAGSQLELIEEAGHHPHEHDIGRVNQLIRKFIG